MIDASVIIPTYNRIDPLRELLTSLAGQDYPPGQFEVIVVDDGSVDDTPSLADASYPFVFRYVRQANQGGVSARNYGGQLAQGQLLIFLDDDMIAEPGYVSGLVEAHAGQTTLISRGKLVPWAPDELSVFTQISVRRNGRYIPTETVKTDLMEFASNNLAVRRDEFLSLGGWREIIVGEPGLKGGIWADLEFAYRAGQNGFSFITVGAARICHRDYVVLSLEATCQRFQKVSQWAVPLLQQYPGLSWHLPMYRDKQPINWQCDSTGLIVRKLLRNIVSQPASVSVLEHVTRQVERLAPHPSLLQPLYRWVVGGYIFQGYREGLRKYGQVKGCG